MRIAKARVLVVEDNDDSRRMIEDLLLSAGFEVLTAVNGAEALRHLHHDVPDAMVLDLMLPWVNGVEVLATMREQPALARVPVLITTGTATSQSDLGAFQPVAVLRKPLAIDTIVPTLENLLGKRVTLEGEEYHLPDSQLKPD
jgi:CheY-like chemotaxis protein